MTSPLMRRLDRLEQAEGRDVSLVEILRCMEAERRGEPLPGPDDDLLMERTPEEWARLPPLVRCLAQFHVDHLRKHGA